MNLTRGDSVRVRGYRGVAFTLLGPEVELVYEEFETEDGEFLESEEPNEVETGLLVVCMVGDDRKITVDPDDVSSLSETEFCGSCGQIGCGHG